MIRALATLSLVIAATPAGAQVHEDEETREITLRTMKTCGLRGDQVRVQKGRDGELVVRRSPTLTPEQNECAKGAERPPSR